jgi:ribosome maturation factor RimP
VSLAQQKNDLLVALEKKAEENGFELVEIEMTGTSKLPILRVYLDKDGGISLDDIASAQQAWIEPLIEEIDPYNGSYTLEVSSPGIDRPLRKLSDYERFAGEEANITVTTEKGPRKRHGILKGVEEEKVVLEIDGTTHVFELSEIKKANIIGKVSFDNGKED